MKLGVSPITNRIFAGNTKINKHGVEEWIKKEDVTDYAISCVFEWFVNNSEIEGNAIYEISYKGFGTLSFDPNGVIKKINKNNLKEGATCYRLKTRARIVNRHKGTLIATVKGSVLKAMRTKGL